jgi:hexokinase
MILFFIHFMMSTLEYQVGKDVAQCLNEALAGSGLNVRVTALVGCFDHFVTPVPTSVGTVFTLIISSH